MTSTLIVLSRAGLGISPGRVCATGVKSGLVATSSAKGGVAARSIWAQAMKAVSVASPAATPYGKSPRSESALTAADAVSACTAVVAAMQRDRRVRGGIELPEPLRSNVMYWNTAAGAPGRGSEHSPPIFRAASSTCVSLHVFSTRKTSFSRALSNAVKAFASGQGAGAPSTNAIGLAHLRRAFWRSFAPLRSDLPMVFWHFRRSGSAICPDPS